ncbi:phage tail assembly protein [Pseudomonas sp. GZD-209]|uniref:phage tail assembly protein n=1 Tax=Pseudomonas sp. GZD-209 TaxID=3404807 RepID=UPI003BB58EC3
MTEVIKLSSPINAYDEERRELKLRRPTVQEVRAIKSLPYKIDQNDEISLDMDTAAKYIAVCAGIPPSAVNQLDLSDLHKASWVIARFFMSAASPTPKA